MCGKVEIMIAIPFIWAIMQPQMMKPENNSVNEWKAG